MILDQRCIAVLTKIAYAPSFVSPLELMEELNVSKRTVYYDVGKINDWLKDNHLEKLIYIRTAGFYLDDKSKKKIRTRLSQFNQEKDYEFSPEERVAWAAIFILTRESNLFLQELIDRLKVSRSTLLADIRELKLLLKHFQVDLKFHKTSGYYVEGEELQKRKVIIYFLSQVMTYKSGFDLLSEIQSTIQHEKQTNHDFLNHFYLDTIYQILTKSEPISGVFYTDEVIQTLCVHLFLLIKRFSQGKHIYMDPVEKNVIKNTCEHKAAQYICREIENAFKIIVPEDETYYITTHLLGAKISNYHPTKVDNQNSASLKQIISNMVDDFQKYSCVFFENRTELERNLFFHLKPAYFRIKYGVKLDNSLAKSLQDSYHDLFMLTKKVVHHFEYVLDKTISNDEVAYIAMHFGGWIDKEGVQVEKRQKAVIVCASGIGTSRILQKQIEELMPTVDVVHIMTVREYEKRELHGIHFIISTIPITEKQLPVYIVNPILTNTEKEFLLKQLQPEQTVSQLANIDALMNIIRSHASITDEEKLYNELKKYYKHKMEFNMEVLYKPMLNELLTEDKIQFIDKAENWESALQYAAQPLLNDHSISQGYIDTMIHNVHSMGPYIVIAPEIALPHARPEAGVNKLSMSFLQLKQSCSFSDKPEHQVRLIFVLAAIDNESHLKALSQLSSMLSDQSNLEKLLSAKTADDVVKIINRYSHE